MLEVCTIICFGVHRHLVSGREISRLQHCLSCIMLVHSHNTLQAVWQHNMSRILYVTLVYCGQMVAWIRRPLGTKVVPSRTVLDGDQAPPNGERHSCPSTFHVYCGETVAHLSYCWALVGILCVLLFRGYCYFMLSVKSVQVQLTAWKDRPRNDLLCVERDVKQLLTNLLTPGG